eukprot:CAMPEP_0174341142 /NCGR_PEP_ID=MMETSP0810-20121108/25188_1 /TAXON_ID=73025 ORGANISM="Eutreptiella gymnastica-like, Strain CCMP1594" /NCGR_SAMPLE_ID=MMETSP0810 /ASSEMBLY_ACC=CAM_ASM_000659 /LENGTH=130 /DNA_ID=CAMNT_0015462627 /DNA_START=419 /DNA_END=811 /DNA_ORIENTATION=-
MHQTCHWVVKAAAIHRDSSIALPLLASLGFSHSTLVSPKSYSAAPHRACAHHMPCSAAGQGTQGSSGTTRRATPACCWQFSICVTLWVCVHGGWGEGGADQQYEMTALCHADWGGPRTAYSASQAPPGVW